MPLILDGDRREIGELFLYEWRRLAIPIFLNQRAL
jgi:hypothetical protein